MLSIKLLCPSFISHSVWPGQPCVWVSGGVGVGLTSYIWHSADVRAEWPHFSALPGI